MVDTDSCCGSDPLGVDQMKQKLSIAEKLKLIQEGSATAMGSLELLSGSSSSVAAALKICHAVDEGPAREMVARDFLNVYAAGFIAGIDFEKTGQ